MGACGVRRAHGGDLRAVGETENGISWFPIREVGNALSRKPSSSDFTLLATKFPIFRLIAAGSDGLQLTMFPADWGVGRFEKIGIIYPGLSAPFVGIVEIICGLLLIVGLLTRLSALLLLIDISVGILTTKVPILMHKGFWPGCAGLEQETTVAKKRKPARIGGGAGVINPNRRQKRPGGVLARWQQNNAHQMPKSLQRLRQTPLLAD